MAKNGPARDSTAGAEVATSSTEPSFNVFRRETFWLRVGRRLVISPDVLGIVAHVVKLSHLRG
jgi:hypothetical protein